MNLKKITTGMQNGNIIFIICIIAIILSGIILRTKLLILNPSYWFDTCALGINIDKSFSELIKPLDCTQVAPVCFMWISKLFYGFIYNGNDIFQKDLSLRVFPYICGVLSLFIFPVLVQKMFKNSCMTLLATFLLAFNVNAIYYSVEFKQYELEMLVSIILLYIFYDWDFKTASKQKLWIYSAIIAISIWFSNSSIFIITVGLLISFINACKNQKHRDFIKYCIPVPLSGLLFIFTFYFPVFNAMFSDMFNHWMYSDPSFLTFGNFFEKFSDKINSLIQLPSFLNVFIIIALNIVIMLFKKNYKALILTTMPIILVILLGFLNLYPFQTRLILFLLPMLIILYLQILTLFKENKFIIVVFSVLLLIACANEIQTPVENYIINKYSSRELFLFIKEQNPQLNNIISTEGSTILQYYGGIESIIDEYSWVDFKKSKIPEFFKTAKNGEYWIYSPHNIDKYGNDLKEYLNSNRNIKVVDINDANNNSFSAKLVLNRI